MIASEKNWKRQTSKEAIFNQSESKRKTCYNYLISFVKYKFRLFSIIKLRNYLQEIYDLLLVLKTC